MEGWATFDYLNDVLNDCQELKYELDNCYKGAYTYKHTYAELAEHIKELARRLESAAEEVACYEEEEDEEEGYEDPDFPGEGEDY